MAKWIVTAYSRLERGRVVVSRPMGEQDAKRAKDKMLADASANKGKRIYLHPHVERVKPEQLNLKFKEYE